MVNSLNTGTVNSQNSVDRSPFDPDTSVNQNPTPATTLAARLQGLPNINLSDVVDNATPRSVALASYGMKDKVGFGKVIQFFGNLWHNLKVILGGKGSYARALAVEDVLEAKIQEFSAFGRDFSFAKDNMSEAAKKISPDEVKTLAKTFSDIVIALKQIKTLGTGPNIEEKTKELSEKLDRYKTETFNALYEQNSRNVLQALRNVENDKTLSPDKHDAVRTILERFRKYIDLESIKSNFTEIKETYRNEFAMLAALRTLKSVSTNLN